MLGCGHAANQASGAGRPAVSSRPREILENLRRGDPVEAAACVVVAHPDDETLGLGGRLADLSRLKLIQFTDGAWPGDALRAGYPDAAAYREARGAERDAALTTLRVVARRRDLGLPDQAAAFHLARLALTLRAELGRVEVAITHAYEGGHPDHDAAAFAVQAACALLARAGRPAPLRLEFAGYHRAAQGRVTGAFWPDPQRPCVAAQITPQRLARKRAALACFGSQTAIVAWFEPQAERYRQAPDYDFTAPPPPGLALYDAWGWPLTSDLWREQARAALAELGLAGGG